VLGTKEPAENGQLVVLAAGPDEALDRCQPIFEGVGQRTLALGEAGEATRLKVVLNHWILTVVEGLAETVALAEGIDVDPRRFLEAISGGPLDSAYAQAKGRLMIGRDFPASFALELALKDAELVREAAARHHLELPLIDAVARQLSRAEEAGHGREDMAATFLASAPTGPRP
jgi:3-hydroxyisobutyrate dehydrogenase